MSDKVYLLDITADNGEGQQSIHATEKSAAWQLFNFIHDSFGVDPRGDDVQVLSHIKEGQAEHLGTSVAAADLELPDGTVIQYAITPFAVENLGQ